MKLEHRIVIIFVAIVAYFAFNYLLGCEVSISTHLTVSILAVVATRYRRRLYVIWRTLPRDASFAYRFLTLLYVTRHYERDDKSVAKIFRSAAKRHPNRIIIQFEDQSWTYQDLEHYSNRVANVFKHLGFKKGEAVGLYMGNCPEYVGLWLGLSKIGVISALINYNQRSLPLAHSLNVAVCKAVIFTEEYGPALKEVESSLENETLLLQLNGSPIEGATSLKNLLDKSHTGPPDCPEPGFRDNLLYIFTSGTTGLPKAAIMPNSKYLSYAMATVRMLRLNDGDCMYNPLPLYHTVGCALGVGPALLAGIRVVLRKKFSASAYFPDCAKYKCTVGQYIGELCRYVLAVPPSPSDKAHNLRLMLGNGLRPTIWKEFVERFNIPQIMEMYGATEGNAGIANLDNTVGAVGFLPQCLPRAIYPVALVKTDLETGKIFRNSQGLCEHCDYNEPGMYIGKINNKDPTREFHGYVDKDRTSSQKKIIDNVFKKGDKYFVTGDILLMDELGYLYFKDRTGETFRWKGENVATAEVEATVCQLMPSRDVAVYGVEVPGAEGRAGMMSIVDTDGSLDLNALAKGFQNTLPSYARPLFLRVVPKLEMTGTFKIKKGDLQKEGFNIESTKDPIFILSRDSYEPLTLEKYKEIIAGKARL